MPRSELGHTSVCDVSHVLRIGRLSPQPVIQTKPYRQSSPGRPATIAGVVAR